MPQKNNPSLNKARRIGGYEIPDDRFGIMQDVQDSTEDLGIAEQGKKFTDTHSVNTGKVTA